MYRKTGRTEYLKTFFVLSDDRGPYLARSFRLTADTCRRRSSFPRSRLMLRNEWAVLRRNRNAKPFDVPQQLQLGSADDLILIRTLHARLGRSLTAQFSFLFPPGWLPLAGVA